MHFQQLRDGTKYLTGPSKFNELTSQPWIVPGPQYDLAYTREETIGDRIQLVLQIAHPLQIPVNQTTSEAKVCQVSHLQLNG